MPHASSAKGANLPPRASEDRPPTLTSEDCPRLYHQPTCTMSDADVDYSFEEALEDIFIVYSYKPGTPDAAHPAVPSPRTIPAHYACTQPVPMRGQPTAHPLAAAPACGCLPTCGDKPFWLRIAGAKQLPGCADCSAGRPCHFNCARARCHVPTSLSSSPCLSPAPPHHTAPQPAARPARPPPSPANLPALHGLPPPIAPTIPRLPRIDPSAIAAAAEPGKATFWGEVARRRALPGGAFDGDDEPHPRWRPVMPVVPLL